MVKPAPPPAGSSGACPGNLGHLGRLGQRQLPRAAVVRAGSLRWQARQTGARGGSVWGGPRSARAQTTPPLQVVLWLHLPLRSCASAAGRGQRRRHLLDQGQREARRRLRPVRCGRPPSLRGLLALSPPIHVVNPAPSGCDWGHGLLSREPPSPPPTWPAPPWGLGQSWGRAPPREGRGFSGQPCLRHSWEVLAPVGTWSSMRP